MGYVRVDETAVWPERFENLLEATIAIMLANGGASTY